MTDLKLNVTMKKVNNSIMIFDNDILLENGILIGIVRKSVDGYKSIYCGNGCDETDFHNKNDAIMSILTRNNLDNR